MGNLLGTQRYAIEEVFAETTLVLYTEQRYFLGTTEIFLRGISAGSRIYSDISADIAVFGDTPSQASIRSILGSESRECQGGVFGERRERNDSVSQKLQDPELEYLVVEGLMIAAITRERINFIPNRKISFYVNLEGAAR